MRICKVCKDEKELEEFPIGRNNKEGRKPICKPCYSNINQEKYYDSEKYKEKYKNDKDFRKKRIDNTNRWVESNHSKKN